MLEKLVVWSIYLVRFITCCGINLQDLYADLFEVRDAKWKNEEKIINVSALFLFLPLYL